MTPSRLLPVLLVAACAAFSSCSRGGDAPRHRTIAGLVYQEDQFFRFVLLGMHDAASRRGAELLEADSDGKPDREIQLINTYIARGVDAIVISPLSGRASGAALSRAREKGITIVTYNTTVEGNIPAAYVESDQKDLGRQTGRAAREYIERRLGGKARVAILEFQSQAPEQNMMRVSGFKEEITRGGAGRLAGRAGRAARGGYTDGAPGVRHTLGGERGGDRRERHGGEERSSERTRGRLRH